MVVRQHEEPGLKVIELVVFSKGHHCIARVVIVDRTQCWRDDLDKLQVRLYSALRCHSYSSVYMSTQTEDKPVFVFVEDLLQTLSPLSVPEDF